MTDALVRVSGVSLLMDWLENIFPAELGGRVGLDDPTPEQLAQVFAGDDGPAYYAQVFSIDTIRDRQQQTDDLDLSIYCRGYKRAETMAFEVEDRLVRYPHRVSHSGRSVVIDRVEVASGATELPWSVDAAVTRMNGTYSLVTRG